MGFKNHGSRVFFIGKTSFKKTIFFEIVEIFGESVFFLLFKRDNFSYGTICPLLCFSFSFLLNSFVSFMETIMQHRFVEPRRNFYRNSICCHIEIGRALNIIFLSVWDACK